MTTTAPVVLRDLPHRLFIRDLAQVLSMSVRTIRTRLAEGTFAITPMTEPGHPNGLDARYSWARRDVEQYLEGGYRSHDRRAVRLTRAG